MAPSSSLQSAVFLLLFNLFILLRHPSLVEATWCVARSDASTLALQTALDYACWAGADCTPIQSNGLCFLPNTIQAHASYAFNSYFQRKSMSPGSCDFSGTANIARTDPSAMDRAFIRVLSGLFLLTMCSSKSL
ncbi:PLASMODESMATA CALLOSE-BINDING PROTEIN 3 [Linum perenne]